MADLFDHLGKLWLRFHLILHALAGVDHGRVVAPAEVEADGLQRVLRELFAEIHGHLPRLNDLALAGFRPHEILRNVEILARDALDLFDGQIDARILDEIPQHVLRHRQVHLAIVQGRVRQQPDQRALEFADVAFHVVGDELDDLVGEIDAVVFGLAIQDGDARLELRLLEVGGQAPLEAGEQPLLDTFDFARRPVARRHDLPSALMQRIEDVEELLLRLLLSAEELDVVDDQQVDVPIEEAELVDSIMLDGLHEVRREALARYVEHRGVALLLHVVSDGLDEMGLAEPYAAIDQERIEAGWSGLLGDRPRSAPGHSIAVAFDASLAGVLLRELAFDALPPLANSDQRRSDRVGRALGEAGVCVLGAPRRRIRGTHGSWGRGCGTPSGRIGAGVYFGRGRLRGA